MQSDTAGLSASVFLPVLGSAALAAAIKHKYIYIYIPVVTKYSFEAAGKAKAVVLQTPRPYTPKT